MKQHADRQRLAAASGAALLAAIALLLGAVLPAEYGWDPLGTGAALGLVGLSAKPESAPLHPQPDAWQTDAINFQLAPFESVEYAYRLEEGATLLFAWRASGEVLYNLHSQPDGMAPDYAASFARGRAKSGAGSYTAPFPGVHGWYFQNRGQQVIELHIETAGFYNHALESSESGTRRRDFVPQRATPATQP